LTLTVVLGTLVATRVGGNAVGRFELNELHRSVSMMTVIFVAIHVTVSVIDSYVPIGLWSVVVPFTSAYRRMPIAVGTIAIDLMIAIWVTSIFKERLRVSTWRFIHWFSWACFAIAVVHGFLTGSDSHRQWSIITTASCVAVVIGSGIWRITQRPDRASGRTAHSPMKAHVSHARSGTPPRAGTAPSSWSTSVSDPRTANDASARVGTPRPSGLEAPRPRTPAPPPAPPRARPR